MPGFLLHQGATVMCSHGGQATPTVPQPRVLVSNQPITTMPNPYIVAGCPIAPSPICVTATWTVAATRVTSGGVPVLLFDSQATTNNGAPLQILVTQMRVKGT
ncbi:MAG: DUF4280 domain-containing protein [Pirellulales bacterium]|nr:DUF4280 domain-containing protein [Pirellulales bacterium]